MHDQLPDHLLRVYRFAMHLCGDQHLAEDLAQEAMLRAVRHCEKLGDPRALQVWLLRIVKNLWIDSCRTRSRHPNELTSKFEVIRSEPQPHEKMERAEEIARTVAAMQSLPERQRTVLHLIACEELTIAETADVLQISAEAVRSSLSLARNRMRQLLPDENAVAKKKQKINKDSIS